MHQPHLCSQTHRISAVLNLLSLPAQVTQDVCAHVLGLQRQAVALLEAPRAVLERGSALQQALPLRVGALLAFGLQIAARVGKAAAGQLAARGAGCG
jgi:hypothetical protein